MSEVASILALIYRPYFSPAVIVLVVALAMGLAGWAWWRSSGARGVSTAGLVMRLTGLAVIGFLLMGPSVLPEADTDPTRTPLHFLVDASGSMQTVDLAAEDSGDAEPISRYRYALENWLSPERLATLEANHDVRVYSFGDRVRAALPEADAATQRQSNVVESTYELLSTMNPANPDESAGTVVLLSDGRDSRGVSFGGPIAAAQLAQARKIKLHTVTLGGATLQRDVALTATPRQPYLMVNEPGQIDVRLEQVNAANTDATFRIRHNGEETSQRVSFTDDARLRIEVPIVHTEPGLQVYELSIDPLPGEAEPANNTQMVFVDVTDERMRVLVLEGRPYWDTKFLAQSLRKDDRVELTQITQINRDRQERIVTRVDGPAVPPRNYEELSKYDVIILGRGMENVLSLEAALDLPRYVSERGGRVVFARGRPYEATTTLGRAIGRAITPVEPVSWGVGGRTDQVMTPTDSGRSHPLFTGLMRATNGSPDERDLPTLASAADIESLKPATRVLAASSVDTQTAEPLLVSMPYGRGMVVGLLGEGLWRWSLAASDNERLVGVFDAFWSNTVRWLVLGADAGPGRDLSLRLSGRSVALDDELTVTVVQRGAAADAAVEAVVIDPAGNETTLSLSDSSGVDVRRLGGYRPTVAGVHTVRLRPNNPENATDTEPISDLETKFTAYDGNTEMLRTAADPALMRALAEGTGGEVLNPRQPDRLLDVLAAELAVRFVPPSPSYVWDRGWVLAAILLWVGLEWIIRKKGGLL
ncbi:MAG: hypothetical protein AAGH99_02570 [Planctomycetota bacterium]